MGLQKRGIVSKPSEARGEESWGEQACKASRGAWQTTIDPGSVDHGSICGYGKGDDCGEHQGKALENSPNKPVSTLVLASSDG